MVFVPDPPITGAVLGTDGSVPRAVPTELLADLLARVLPVAVVQQGLLLAVFVLAGAGAARLVPGLPGAAAAALGYAWTPYLAERLLIGHWPFLLGYALLPWVVGAALAARRGGSLRPLLLWLAAAAAAGSTSALIATATALCVLAWRHSRSTPGPAPGAPVRRGGGVRGGGEPAVDRAGAGPAGRGARRPGRRGRVRRPLRHAARAGRQPAHPRRDLEPGDRPGRAGLRAGRGRAGRGAGRAGARAAAGAGRQRRPGRRRRRRAGAGRGRRGARPRRGAPGGRRARARRRPAPGRAEAAGAGRACRRARRRPRGRPAGQGAADGAPGGAARRCCRCSRCPAWPGASAAG